MEYWKDKVAIVTGAAQGIGAKIAEDLVRSGMTVIGFELSEEKVSEMVENVNKWGKVQGQLIPCKCDISNESDLKTVFEGIVEAHGGVDLLVNNAAAGKAGLLSTGKIEDFKKNVDVNIFGLMACTRYAIESMVKRQVRGHIININSICGHYMPPFAEPKVTMYIASKRAMTLINKLLKNELKMYKHNIKVTSISPGIVKTGLFKSSGVDFVDDDFFNRNPHLSTKDVSDVVLMILKMNPKVQVNEVLFHALHEVY